MSKVCKVAHEYMMRAYAHRGRTSSYDLGDWGLTPEERYKLADILKEYGELEGLRFGVWDWLQLNDKGIEICKRGGYMQFLKDKEKERKEVTRKRQEEIEDRKRMVKSNKLDITLKWIEIFKGLLSIIKDFPFVSVILLSLIYLLCYVISLLHL